jgi:hypothetical protein
MDVQLHSFLTCWVEVSSQLHVLATSQLEKSLLAGSQNQCRHFEEEKIILFQLGMEVLEKVHVPFYLDSSF